jgi:hypothetical protein
MDTLNTASEWFKSQVLRITKPNAWVIQKEINRYYQFVRIEGDNVVLTRHGENRIVNLLDFSNKFSIATEDDVTRHLKYLKYNGYDYVGKEQLTKNFDPSKCEFYMLTCKGVHGSVVRHTSYEIAEKEAERIAKKENHKVWILGVVGTVEVNSQVITEIKKKF